MLDELKELYKYRALLIGMVRRELKIRYKNSILGFLWSFINPLMTVLVMTVVFKYIIGIKTANYSAYVLAGYLPFTFFQMALMDSAQSVVGSLALIRKVYFPREILPLTNVIANFIHLLLAMCMFFVYLAAIYVINPAQSPFRMTAVFLPFLLILNFCLATGLGLLISALNVFYEDVKYIVGILTYLLFFLCPVMYSSEQVYYRGATTVPSHPQLVYLLYFLNPVATMVNAYRKLLLAPQPYITEQVNAHGKTVALVQAPVPLSMHFLLIASLVSIFILWYGYRVFNKMKWRFVERV